MNPFDSRDWRADDPRGEVVFYAAQDLGVPGTGGWQARPRNGRYMDELFITFN